MEDFYKIVIFTSSGRGCKYNIFYKDKCCIPGVLTLVPPAAVVSPGDNTGQQVKLTDHPGEPSLSHPPAALHILHILQTSQLLQKRLQ